MTRGVVVGQSGWSQFLGQLQLLSSVLGKIRPQQTHVVPRVEQPAQPSLIIVLSIDLGHDFIFGYTSLPSFDLNSQQTQSTSYAIGKE
jgi:hypothetical protein